MTVKAAYIGATGGIAAVAGSLPVKFLPNNAVTGSANPDPTVAGNGNDPQVPDIALSTNFVSSSPFIGIYQEHFYEDLTPQDEIISVVGLKWVASKGFPADNITPQLARYLWANGSAPLELFTGNPAEQNKIVFATGRNLDAGQRFAAQAESGLGINAVVKQYKPTISGASAGVGGFVTGGTVNSHVLWPVETFSGVSSQFPGNSGATTGANLASLLTATLGSGTYSSIPGATADYYISYLTPGDADTIAIPNGAVELKWNGVAYSNANIQQGKYTFWVYEHLFYNAATAAVDASNLRGGNEIIWSSNGNIAAGASSKTVQSAPPTRVILDPQSADVKTDLAGLATGGGIGVLATVKGVSPGDVDLIAPEGSVDAGDAGIRVTGNLNIAAVIVLNADNISLGGTSTGTPVAPVVTTPNLSGLASVSNTSAVATTTADEAAKQARTQPPAQDDTPSLIIVKAPGYDPGDEVIDQQASVWLVLTG